MAASQAHIAPSTQMGRRHLLASRDSALARFMRDQACPVRYIGLSMQRRGSHVIAKPFRTRTKVRLGDFRSLRAELCCVYRVCVRGDVDWADGQAAVAILGAIATMDRDATFEDQLAALEAVLEQRGLPRANGHDSPELRR
jgi:hypothetical protein